MTKPTVGQQTFALPEEAAEDRIGAFMAHAPYALEGYAHGSGVGALSGLTVGIKDLYDVAGLRTGAGSPAWLAEADPAASTAPAVQALFDAGARFVGKTLTDELAWSLNGENAHYGTPENVAAPGRIPGGSSAGSAAAVAAGMCDIALGSDTGGSVRAPASYCGVWGLRPTHGRISLEGAVALAPSFDTAGWFAANAAHLALVGQVLLPNDDPFKQGNEAERLLVAEDLFERVDEALRPALLEKLRVVAQRLGLVPEFITLVDADAPLGSLSRWREAFSLAQSAEVWEVHGAWVTRTNPTFGPGIADRFEAAKALTSNQIEAARAARSQIASYLYKLLGQSTLLLVPGAAGVAPLKGLQGPTLNDIRFRALEVLCPAGHGGLPQLALPAVRTADGPLGLGLIAPRGGDALLLSLAKELEDL